MLAPIVVLYVAASELDTAGTEAIARALGQAMAAQAAVVVRATEDGSAPALAASCAEPAILGAASVSWRSAPGAAAEVLVHHCGAGEDARFHLTFAPADPPHERARSVGFVIASALHASSKPTAAAQAAPAPPASMEPRRRFLLGAFATTSVPLGGAGGGLGAGLAVRSAWTERWDGRLGLHWRTGQIPAAQASISEGGLAAGIGFAVLPRSRGLRPAVGLRADVSVLYESIVHFSSDDPAPVGQYRILPAADTRCELRWPLGSVDLHLAAGIQAAFGVADVMVRGRRVAELRPFRGIVEIGFGVGL